MKELVIKERAIRFPGKTVVPKYRYAIYMGALDDVVVVIEQTKESYPSVTNAVEDVANKILRAEKRLHMVSPEHITWYLYYPESILGENSGRWLYRLCRVTFEMLYDPSKAPWHRKLKRKLFGADEREMIPAVDDPTFEFSDNKELIERLTKLFGLTP